jgi:hypothetical protein
VTTLRLLFSVATIFLADGSRIIQRLRTARQPTTARRRRDRHLPSDVDVHISGAVQIGFEDERTGEQRATPRGPLRGAVPSDFDTIRAFETINAVALVL